MPVVAWCRGERRASDSHIARSSIAKPACAMRTSKVRSSLFIAVISALFVGLARSLANIGASLDKYPLAAADWLSGALASERLLDFSPLYLGLHVAAAKLGAGETGMHALQVAAVAFAAVCLFDLLRRVVVPAAAIGALVLFTCARSVGVHTELLEPEALLLAFVSGFLCFAHRSGPRAPLAAGVFFGLSLITRPTLLLAVPLVGVWYWLGGRRGRSLGATLAAFALPVLLLLAPVWARNALLPGKFSLLVMNPGTVFYEGNNPCASGVSATYPPVVELLRQSLTNAPDVAHEAYRLVSRRAAGVDLPPSVVNEEWTARALAFAWDHPSHAGSLLLLKLASFWHGFELHDTTSAFFGERALAAAPLPTLPHAPIAALALIGLALSLRAWRRWLLVYATLLAPLAVELITYVSARQRLAALPALIVLAAVTLDHLARLQRGRALWLGLVAVLSLALNLPTELSREESHLWSALHRSTQLARQAATLRQAGDLDRASELSAQSLAAAPWLREHRRQPGLSYAPEGWPCAAIPHATTQSAAERFDLALLLLDCGKALLADETLAKLEDEGVRFHRHNLQSSTPAYFRARAAHLLGQQQDARRHLDRALSLRPGDPWALAMRTVVDHDVAAERALVRYFGELDAAFLVGRAAFELGDPTRAVRALGWVTRHLPELRLAWQYQALALAALGKHDEAAAALARAMALATEPVL